MRGPGSSQSGPWSGKPAVERKAGCVPTAIGCPAHATAPICASTPSRRLRRLRPLPAHLLQAGGRGAGLVLRDARALPGKESAATPRTADAPPAPHAAGAGGGAAARLRSRLRSRLVALVLVAAPVGLLLRQCDRFCEAQDMHDLFCQMRDVCKPAGAKCPPPWRRTPPHLPARCLQGSGRANASQSAA